MATDIGRVRDADGAYAYATVLSFICSLHSFAAVKNRCLKGGGWGDEGACVAFSRLIGSECVYLFRPTLQLCSRLTLRRKSSFGFELTSIPQKVVKDDLLFLA